MGFGRNTSQSTQIPAIKRDLGGMMQRSAGMARRPDVGQQLRQTFGRPGGSSSGGFGGKSGRMTPQGQSRSFQDLRSRMFGRQTGNRQPGRGLK